MKTEVWYRNPSNYIRELVECGEFNIAWDYGALAKVRLDPIRHAELYFGQTYPWRVMCIGPQGSAEYRFGDTLDSPTAVYPTWSYGEDAAILEEIIERPVGQDQQVCNDKSVPKNQRPVFGQEHRVVITDFPDTRRGPGRQFLAYLKSLQDANPDCIIHVHGLYSYKFSFGMGWGSSDVDPRTPAQKGNIVLTSGRPVKYEEAFTKPLNVTQFGYKPVDLEVPSNRCKFNIQTARWAADNFNELYRTPSRNTGQRVDTDSPTSQFKPIEAGSIIKVGSKVKPGDKMRCDTCSLQTDCKYFRDGAVCTVPGAEPRRLAEFFKTRNSDLIIEGLGTLLAASANRLEREMNEEAALGDVSPEVTKMLAQVFEQGMKYAKLVDPNLRAPVAKVSVNVSGGNVQAVASANPRAVVAALFAELESKGIPREEITTEMVQNLLVGMSDNDGLQRAINGSRNDIVEGEII